jgi:hypothetical protein
MPLQLLHPAVAPRADARSDEGPPFEVRSSLPLLGIASILSSADSSAKGKDGDQAGANPGPQQHHGSVNLDSAIPQDDPQACYT